MRKVIVTTFAAMAVAAALPSGAVAWPSAAEAGASYCPVGGSGITVNRGGYVAKFGNLRPMQGMNCPSAST